MARRRTTTKQALDTDETARQNPRLAGALEMIDGEMKGGTYFNVPGTPMATIQLPDGTYRRRALNPGQDLCYDGAYIGASNKPNFRFTPEDAQDYTYVEFNPKELDASMPSFGETLWEAFGNENFPVQPTVAGVLPYLLKMVAEEQKVVEVTKEEEFVSTYKDHPLFGRF